MSQDLWTVLSVTENTDGGRTLTMRNQRTGAVLTENYPAGATVLRAVRAGEEDA